MKFLLIFILGIGILIGAIMLNYLASKIGFSSWFEFLKNPSETKLISYIWLFFIYPLGLGLIGYYLSNLLKI